LGIHSALHLPELVSGEQEAEIVVRFGQAERSRIESGEAARLVWGTAQEVHLAWRGVGAFVVRDGREIIVDPLPGVEERVLRLCVLGSCLGVVLLQRGLTVFHSSVVGLPCGAIAFLALKGHGKSSMAAALHARGHRMVADDIMVIDDAAAVDGDEDRLLVRPGFPQFKLWPKAAQAIGQDPESLPVLHPTIDKRAYRVSQSFLPRPLPLQAVYVLGIDHEIEIALLTHQNALMCVLPHWYGAMFDRELLRVFGLDTHFAAAMRLVKGVPIYLLKRPPALELLPEVARRVEEHALGAREPTPA
jgi:hypothetical protein